MNKLEKYRQVVMEHSAKGLSAEEILTELCYKEGVLDKEVFEEIKKNDKDYMELVKEYHDLAYAYWMSQGRAYLVESYGKGMESERINYNVWLANMRHRFGWVEKAKVEVSGMIEHSLADRLRDARERRKVIESSSVDTLPETRKDVIDADVVDTKQLNVEDATLAEEPQTKGQVCSD